MITRVDLVDELLALPDQAREPWLAAHTPLLDDQLAEALKARADTLLHADVRTALRIAGILATLAAQTGDPHHRALGLLAEANARSIGLAEYQRSIDLYDEAAELYAGQNRPVDQARAQIGKLTALGRLGRHAEVAITAQWASEILAAHDEWLLLGKLTVNLAVAQDRLWESGKALALYDRAAELYRRVGDEGAPYLARVELARAIALRNLSRFQASIEANRSALAMLDATGQTVQVARARQNLGITYTVLGQYNEALLLLEEAQTVFLADGRHRDAILIDLFVAACLLQLRRFAEVLEKAGRARRRFAELGTPFEIGQAAINEAVAYTGLGQFDEALAAGAAARQQFDDEGNQVWVARCDLERGAILLRQGEAAASLSTAQSCIDLFVTHDLPLEAAQARLIAAQAALALDRRAEARALVDAVLAVSQEKDLPALAYQARRLLGALAQAQGDLAQALAGYDRAIQEVERLRGNLMVEHRAGFLEDKQGVYEDIVDVALALDRPEQGLAYVERAKSRSLVDLLAFRIDLRIRPRAEQDAALVAELHDLRQQRDRLYRRWESDEEFRLGNWAATGEPAAQQVQQRILALDKAITAAWHRLLVRNADYARDAALWRVQAEPVQPRLPPDTLLVEYFVVHGQIVVFLATRETVQARRLDASIAQVESLRARLNLNLRTVPRSAPSYLGNLTTQANRLLGRLYDALVAPVAELLAPHQRLLLVPHGALHYLPLHALHDGRGYLLERHSVSYLPSASLLSYLAPPRRAEADTYAAVFGNSYGGRLPHAVQEARLIGDLLDAPVWVEDAVTLAQVQAASSARILHLATHGEFQPGNPLFSGVALAEGWLSTLDVFQLELASSLVTLSACSTGQHVVGGGDELLGLMRAFLYAGAASLLLTLWAVEDRSTMHLMTSLYGRLAAGDAKDAALRQAQLELACGDGPTGDRYRHPYFWAPFFLVGDAGPL